MIFSPWRQIDEISKKYLPGDANQIEMLVPKGEVQVFQRESGVKIATSKDPGTIWQERESPTLNRKDSGVTDFVYHLVRDDGTTYLAP